MRRGEIWTGGGAKDYAGKPRPVLIIQDDSFSKLDSVTICLFTTNAIDASLVRPVIEPSISNGLRAFCRLMVDKIMTVPKSRLGVRIGRLADEDLVRLNRAILVFLGIAAPKE
jgi:mRNA interferase MazF